MFKKDLNLNLLVFAIKVVVVFSIVENSKPHEKAKQTLCGGVCTRR